MTTTHREKDIERFDDWASTYEHSWMQRAFFDPAHQATLALAAAWLSPPSLSTTGRIRQQASAR